MIDIPYYECVEPHGVIIKSPLECGVLDVEWERENSYVRDAKTNKMIDGESLNVLLDELLHDNPSTVGVDANIGYTDVGPDMYPQVLSLILTLFNEDGRQLNRYYCADDDVCAELESFYDERLYDHCHLQ